LDDLRIVTAGSETAEDIRHEAAAAQRIQAAWRRREDVSQEVAAVPSALDTAAAALIQYAWSSLGTLRSESQCGGLFSDVPGRRAAVALADHRARLEELVAETRRSRDTAG
jgi:hypothetical protein